MGEQVVWARQTFNLAAETGSEFRFRPVVEHEVDWCRDGFLPGLDEPAEPSGNLLAGLSITGTSRQHDGQAADLLFVVVQFLSPRPHFWIIRPHQCGQQLADSVVTNRGEYGCRF